MFRYIKLKQGSLQNRGPPGATQQPRMFIKFLAGAFHPFIHIGYGVEVSGSPAWKEQIPDLRSTFSFTIVFCSLKGMLLALTHDID
jgi:hypothetical protein